MRKKKRRLSPQWTMILIVLLVIISVTIVAIILRSSSSEPISGKAVDFGGCLDPDSTSTYDKNSLLTKSTTTYASGSKEDKCYTWNKGTPQEKTRLIEGTCKNGKFLYWYATCSDYLGKDFKCQEGKCVQDVSDFALEEVPLDWDLTKPIMVKKINGIVAEGTNLNGNKVSLQNLKLNLFMDAELKYYAQISWETSIPAELSGVATNVKIISKLKDQPYFSQKDYVTLLGPSSQFKAQPDYILTEDSEFMFNIKSFFDYFPTLKKNHLEYNLSIKTPPISKMNLECNNILNSGSPSNKIDLIFIPIDYSQDELNNGLFEKDVNNLLFESNKESEWIEQRRGFFEIPVFNQSSNVFNIIFVNQMFQSSSYNQVVSAGKSCNFDKKDDFIILVHNSDLGMANVGWAVGLGNTIEIFKSDGFTGFATTLAHELAHLLGVDEEYYILEGGVTEPRDAQNCDYGNLTCSKWCAGVDSEKAKTIHTAKEKYDTCIKILTKKDEPEWKEFCPTLNLKNKIDDSVMSGASFFGAKSQEEFCALPLSKINGYACYAGTFWSLDRDEGLNLGINCQEGYQCYYGCGTKYQYTRSTFIGIMGGGFISEESFLWKQKEKNSGEKILPDFSPAANQALKEYLSKYQ